MNNGMTCIRSEQGVVDTQGLGEVCVINFDSVGHILKDFAHTHTNPFFLSVL